LTVLITMLLMVASAAPAARGRDYRSAPAHCQAKVEKALKGVSGVYSAVIALPDGEAEVDFDDDRVTAAQLIGAVQHAGSDAKLAG